MSELRHNVITGDWVIIASERARRPADFKKARYSAAVVPAYQKDCPFCIGNEAVSGEETFRISDGGSWLVRCLYNKFPALSPKEDLARCSDSLYGSITGFGFHEVLVENTRHDVIIPLMPDVDVENVIGAYRSRYGVLERKNEVETIIIFKNQGPQAGASLVHPHSQIIATPITPPSLRHRVDRALRYFEAEGRCIFCDMLKRETEDKKRVILETDNFVSFVPFAPAAPFLTWIFPRRHIASFGEINDTELKDMSRHLKKILSKLYRGLDNPDYNFTIRSAPVREKAVKYFHWYLSIVPRIINPAGFELGSGIFINPSIPEECAEFLRGCGNSR
jgi:UDPglucose--hexose-1-phosphate uridylyltransferase